MNKKRKILTVAALAVFSAIIALHYLGIPAGYQYWPGYQEPHYFRDKTVNPPTSEEMLKRNTHHFLDFVFEGPDDEWIEYQGDRTTYPPKPPTKTPTKRITAKEYKKNLKDAKSGGQWVLVEYPAKGKLLWKNPAIIDVRMPLFVLAVFYTGLFFILGESTTPTKPKPDE